MITLGVGDVELALSKVHAALGPIAGWYHDCHAASTRVVERGPFPTARVARGTCDGVGAQHSWVVVNGDPYAADAVILDPTLWSYDSTVKGIWTGTAARGRHVPHNGVGTIWQWGKPTPPTGPVINLTPTFELSSEARFFLDLFGPLDHDGWWKLTHAPVKGWPAGEIFAAMDDTPDVAALVPIDLLGMLTDRNPEGIYPARGDIER